MLKNQEIVCKNLDELKLFAKQFLPVIKKHQFLLMNGDLGAGKTALVKELGLLIGIKENINSPSFNYMKNYEGLVHIDLYSYKGDLEEFEDFFEDNIVAIEWANLSNYNFKNFIKMNVTLKDDLHVYKIVEVK
ncbi:tRNA (adenosine(37)-N6)-threonylcarbamoyltransferase complex ATPase subunit type 1 TsaE [Mycoplasmopsis alligatoris]|nr:tRNA (adenosine(37)-N6)-threonylcarbamoyltransferase complex ATPase subunit type 1 TsaE [Mycoplasmopsis alligatoris]